VGREADEGGKVLPSSSVGDYSVGDQEGVWRACARKQMASVVALKVIGGISVSLMAYGESVSVWQIKRNNKNISGHKHHRAVSNIGILAHVRAGIMACGAHRHLLER